MEIKVERGESNHLNEQQQPLLRNRQIADAEHQNTPMQIAISRTFKSTAHLANLLPTGTVLAFQLLSPILSNNGQCSVVNRSMMEVLVALCGISCFLLCFTDSFRDGNGNVYHGLATFRGLWVIDGTATISPEQAEEFRLNFIDFVHAFVSVLVFVAVVLFDQNVVKCFYPAPSGQAEELLTKLPVGIGVICSMLFIAFPTKRHGIGFPVSSR